MLVKHKFDVLCFWQFSFVKEFRSVYNLLPLDAFGKQFAHSATCTSTPLFSAPATLKFGRILLQILVKYAKFVVCSCWPAARSSPCFPPLYSPQNALASVHLRLSRISFRLNPRQGRISSNKFKTLMLEFIFYTVSIISA